LCYLTNWCQFFRAVESAEACSYKEGSGRRNIDCCGGHP